MVGVTACIARIVAVFLRMLTAPTRLDRTSLRIPGSVAQRLVDSSNAPEARRSSRTKSSEEPDHLLSDRGFIETLTRHSARRRKGTLDGAQELKREAFALLRRGQSAIFWVWRTGVVTIPPEALDSAMRRPARKIKATARRADEAGRDDARLRSYQALCGAGRKRRLPNADHRRNAPTMRPGGAGERRSSFKPTEGEEGGRGSRRRQTGPHRPLATRTRAPAGFEFGLSFGSGSLSEVPSLVVGPLTGGAQDLSLSAAAPLPRPPADFHVPEMRTSWICGAPLKLTGSAFTKFLIW
jgi:hypothetical protein